MFKYSIILLILLLSSCQKKGHYEPLEFQVDKNLVQTFYQTPDSLLSINFPTGWQKLENSLLQRAIKVTEEAKETEDPLTILDIETIFSDSTNRNIAVINYQESAMPFEEFCEKIKGVFTMNYNNCKHIYFRNNNLNLFQLWGYDENIVNVRVIHKDKDNNKIFSVNYFFSIKYYDAHAKVVESSIGSLK